MTTQAERTQLGFSIGELADLAGVTVRTLHHYDRIGLVRPSHRTAAGYRCYTDADADRLAQTSAMGTGLRPRSDSHHPRRAGHRSPRTPTPAAPAAGRTHRQTAAHRVRDRHHIGGTDDGNHRTHPAQKLEVFGDFDPNDHAAEAEKRWGETDAYRQSAARTKGHTKAEWVEITAEGAANTNALAEAMAAGLPATSTEAMDAAEQARQHISRWFYDCPAEMHRNLGDMYIADERFTATYEKVAPSLASYVRDAIHANADRAEA